MNAIGTSSMQQDNEPRREGGAIRPAIDASREPPARHLHRAREFGIGYGDSSGYGSALHFTDGHRDAPFRVG